MIWKNIKHIFKHKWYVFQECRKLGLFWRGLVHDLSKFNPCEFFPYAINFFSGRKMEWREEERFAHAWLHHQHTNPHHWQYYVQYDRKGCRAYPMVVKDALEMIADWKAISRQFNNNIIDWYNKNKAKMLLHSDTIKFVERELKNN